MNRQRIVSWMMRFLLGTLFLYAAGSKLWDPAAFALDVQNYRLLPAWAISIVALLLPALEAVAGVAILAGRWKSEAALWIAVMLVAFLFGEIQALARGLDLTCGCFGAGSGKVDFWSIARNAVLLVLCASVIRIEAGFRREDEARRRDAN